MTLRNKLLPILTVLTVIHLRADDGAASIAAGGLVVMKQEPRITMAKEVLQISASKVIVDYDFRNDSDENVTTEIAFPVADYAYDTDRKGSEQGFDDFRLWVDRVPARFHTEARAFVNGKEYTQLLASMHVDVASYGHGPLMGDVNGHRQPLAKSQDIQRLTAAQREQLGKVGLIALDWDDEPLWHVRKKYYWQQTFPAHKIVHIRHEYTPVLGSENSVSYGMGPSSDPNMAKELKSFCIDGHLRATLEGGLCQGQERVVFLCRLHPDDRQHVEDTDRRFHPHCGTSALERLEDRQRPRQLRELLLGWTDYQD
jgi:hypothetical protein